MAATNKQQQPFRLFDLPAELQLRIFEDVYRQSQHRPECAGQNHTLTQKRTEDPVRYFETLNQKCRAQMSGLLSVSRAFRTGILTAWAELETHIVPLQLRISKADGPNIGSWEYTTKPPGLELGPSASLPDTYLTALETFLCNVEGQLVGLARKVRNVTIYAAQEFVHLRAANAENDAEIFDPQQYARMLNRLDGDLFGLALTISLQFSYESRDAQGFYGIDAGVLRNTRNAVYARRGNRQRTATEYEESEAEQGDLGRAYLMEWSRSRADFVP